MKSAQCQNEIANPLRCGDGPLVRVKYPNVCLVSHRHRSAAVLHCQDLKCALGLLDHLAPPSHRLATATPARQTTFDHAITSQAAGVPAAHSLIHWRYGCNLQLTLLFHHFFVLPNSVRRVAEYTQ